MSLIIPTMHGIQLPAIQTKRQPLKIVDAKVADVLVERINTAYSREDGKRDGIYYWPDALPTPDLAQLPDPLVLFQPDDTPGLMATERLATVPLSLHQVLVKSSMDQLKPSMQVPLGLIDKPEVQQRDTLLIDLHGSGGALTGGPLLIAGMQNSGKATALQTILLWFTARYRPHQFRCAVIDPNHDLDLFQDLPHLCDDDGTTLWTEGSTDEQVTQLANRIANIANRRREKYADLRWDDDTLLHLWMHGETVPLLLLIISNYHRFIERAVASNTLRRLVLSIVEAHALGFYVVMSSAEVNARHISPDIMGKMGTKIGLFLNEQQRYDLFGRPPMMDLIPGRGYMLTRDRELHQVQLALPVSGATESLRREVLKGQVQWLSSQD